MEGKKRSWEFVAIPATAVILGALAILMWAYHAGLWAWLAVGAVVLGAAIVVLIRQARTPHHPKGTIEVARADDGVHRVLLVADVACSSEAISIEQPAEVLVIAPALGSRTARWTGDEHAYQAASEHLDMTLRALAAAGVPATGRIGSHDPLQAADDGLRSFAADEIVFAVEAGDRRNWLEQGVADEARERYPIPVRELEVPVRAPSAP